MSRSSNESPTSTSRTGSSTSLPLRMAPMRMADLTFSIQVQLSRIVFTWTSEDTACSMRNCRSFW